MFTLYSVNSFSLALDSEREYDQAVRCRLEFHRLSIEGSNPLTSALFPHRQSIGGVAEWSKAIDMPLHHSLSRGDRGGFFGLYRAQALVGSNPTSPTIGDGPGWPSTRRDKLKR